MQKLCAVVGVSLSCAGNPFEDNTAWYVNPANQKEYDGSIATSSGEIKSTLEAMKAQPSAYWIDRKNKITGTSTSTVEGILTDAASKTPPELVTLIFYDLPNRDCDAKASNGEICCYANADGTCNYDTTGDCADGIEEYKTGYVDPFVSVLASFKGKVPIVLIVEPDSIPNLATNSGHPHCGNSATQAAYQNGIQYALEQLTSKTDATLYLDAAHGGWLGWEDNLEKYLNLLKQWNLPMSKLRGFATNVANYQPLGKMCPFTPDQGYRNKYCLNNEHQTDECCSDPCKLESQWNPGNNELNYAQDLIQGADAILGMDAHVVIDTGRNGVADMRSDCSNWCNIKGAGAGVAPTVNTGNKSVIDAYFWLKTPGESDGCTQTLPDGGQCARYDSMCGSADSMSPAPEAGSWFDAQVKMLAENAVPLPSPTPTPPSPTPTPSPTPSPTPPAPTPTTTTPASGCPGGSLQACIDMCPSDVFQACCASCADRCPSTITV